MPGQQKINQIQALSQRLNGIMADLEKIERKIALLKKKTREFSDARDLDNVRKKIFSK